MTVKEIREALGSCKPDDDVLVCVNREQYHYAVKSVGQSLGGCPAIRCAGLPVGKAAQRA